MDSVTVGKRRLTLRRGSVAADHLLQIVRSFVVLPACCPRSYQVKNRMSLFVSASVACMFCTSEALVCDLLF